MKLKKKVNKEQHATLSDAVKELYVADGENFVLDVEPDEGDEDTGALKRAKTRETERRKEAEKELQELREKLDASETLDAKKRGDIEVLEKSWSAKNEALKKQYEDQVAKYKSHIQSNLVDSVATKLASELTDSPELIMPHLKSRLKADFEADTPTTRILDKDGKISALTVDELKQEFVANKTFSAIIKAGQGSGGAGAGQRQQPQVFGERKEPANLASVKPSDLVALIDSKKP